MPPEELTRLSDGESSDLIRARVVAARERMQARQKKENARLSPRETEKLCAPDDKGRILLNQAITRLALSARGYHRILRIARTIADLVGIERVSASHIAEAIQYRRLDRAM